MTQNSSTTTASPTATLNVGLVGTGYAAKRRAEALQADPRAKLVLVAGHRPESTEEFAQTYNIESTADWRELVETPAVDLVVISTINRDHALIARAALEAGKNVVVEYPLALTPEEAADLIALSQTKERLLHVEHIELLGSLHQTIRQYLQQIGQVFYTRYVTINPQRPIQNRWTYHHQLFGFPLCAALSRLHRFTDLFGEVATVSGQSRFWEASEGGYYKACLCCAQLNFTNGIVGEVVYGKGETFWHGIRTFEIHGEEGTLIFEGSRGKLVREDEEIIIELGGRRGLFAKDTKMVLDNLLEEEPLYVTPENSYYALRVADAVRKSATSGEVQKV